MFFIRVNRSWVSIFVSGVFLTIVGVSYLNFTTADQQTLNQTNQPNLARVGAFSTIDTESSTPDGRLLFSIKKAANHDDPEGNIEIVALRQFSENSIISEPQDLRSLFGDSAHKFLLKDAGVVPFTTDLKNQLIQPDIMNVFKYNKKKTVQFDINKVINLGAHHLFVGHDPRFGENAFPVPNPGVCVNEAINNPDLEETSILENTGGEYLCYKLIAFRRFTMGHDGYLVKRMFQSYLSIALQVKQPDGMVLSYPRVVAARYSHPYNPSFARSENAYQSPCTAKPNQEKGPCLRPFSGMEGVPASDARLLVWNEPSGAVGSTGAPSRPLGYEYHIPMKNSPGTLPTANSYVNSLTNQLIFSFNHTPWKPNSWWRPVYSDQLHNRYGNQLICPQGTEKCNNNKKTIFLKDQFKIAGKRLRDARGEPLPSHGQCIYPWFTPGGNNLVCRFNSLETVENDKRYCQNNSRSLNEQCYANKKMYIVGSDTGYYLKTISGPINGFSEYATAVRGTTLVEENGSSRKICLYPNLPESDCTKLYSDQDVVLSGQGVKVPLVIGFTGGFWKSNILGQPQNLFLNKRPYTFNFYMLHDVDFKNFNVRRYNSDESELSLNEFSSSSKKDLHHYVYGEISFDDFLDKNFLFFHHFEPPVVPILSGYDSNKNWHFLYSNLKEKCLNYGPSHYWQLLTKRKLKGCSEAGVPFDIQNQGTVYDSSAMRRKGFYSEEAILEDEYYQELLANDNKNVAPLIKIVNSKVVYSQDGYSGKGLLFTGGSGNVAIENPLPEGSLDQFSFEMAVRGFDSRKTNQDFLSYDGQLASWDGVFKLELKKRKIRLSLYGQKKVPEVVEHTIGSYTKNINKYTHIGIAVQSQNIKTRVKLFVDGYKVVDEELFVNSSVSFSPTNGAKFILGPNGNVGEFRKIWIDEVALSKNFRDSSYFSIAAFRNSDVDLEANNLFPFKIPFGFSVNDLRLPSELKDVLSMPSNRIEQTTNLGQQLFNSQVLGLTGDGGRSNITCQTCHIPEASFADNLPLSTGLGVGNKNVPILLNRAFGKKQHWESNISDVYEQVVHPILNEKEMGGDLNRILRKLNDEPFKSKFRSAFGMSATDEVKEDHLRSALSLYVLSITAGANQTPENEIFERGRNVFNNKGRCIACHTGPNFTDELTHNTGFGLEVKTPSLINLSQTAPYFHNGAFYSLADVVEFYNNGGNTFAQRLDPEIKPLGLSSREKASLIYFLENLKGKVSHGKESLSWK